MTTELLEVNRKTHWQRVQVRGVFKRAKTALGRLGTHLQAIRINTGTPEDFSAETRCSEILVEMKRLEEEAAKLLEDAYSKYRAANPPKRDRKRDQKRGS